VNVVARSELSEYTDILLMPIEAHRSLASLLGGGDYDGGTSIEHRVTNISQIIDTILVVWHPEIMENFVAAPRTFADPPAGFGDNFEQNNITVKDMLKSYPEFSSDLEQQQALAEALQKSILDGLPSQNLISKVRFSAFRFLYSGWEYDF
jgi:hypothetical protein